MGWVLFLAGAGLSSAFGLLPDVAPTQPIPLYQQVSPAPELRGSGYSVRIMRGGREIEISGEFGEGLNATFERALRETPTVETVHLSSIGGLVVEGERVRDTIRGRGLDTYVSGFCGSACTLAFMGGSQRWIHPRGKLGYHSFAMGRGWGWLPVSLFLDQYQGMYLESGVEAAFVEHIFTVPNEEVWEPSLDELAAAGVITGVAATSQFALSGFGIDTSLEGFGETVARLLPILAALRDRDQPAFWTLVETLRTAYLAGVTETEFARAARDRFLPALRAHLARADGPTLTAFGALLVEEYQHLLAVRPDVCAAYALGSPLGNEAVNHLPDSLIAAEAELGERVLRTSADRAPLPAAAVDSYWGDVIRQVYARPGLAGFDATQIASPSWVASHGREVCAFSIAMFEEVLELGEPGTSALLRDSFRALAPAR